MPRPREIILWVDGPRNDLDFRLVYHVGEVSDIQFLLQRYGDRTFYDIESGSTVQLVLRDILGTNLPTAYSDPNSPRSNWAEGLVSVPVTPANLTHHVTTLQAALVLLQPDQSLVAGLAGQGQ